MKKTITLILSIISLFSLAQVPQGVGYQGVATDGNGIELVNQSISIRASVISGSANGTIEWQETHATTTDTFGLFTITIGQGTSTGNGIQADFADISWGINTHFLKIEMDVNGGTNYAFMGTNQMMSVPYALYAESANISYDSIANYLSGDTTFITNVSSGLAGGGCDYQYPEGLDGERMILNLGNGNYTVPTGKKLYMTSVKANNLGATYYAKINNNIFDLISDNDNPIIAQGGDIISVDNYSPNNTNSQVTVFGFMIDDTQNIERMIINLGNGNYTVPAGKKLYMTSVKANNLGATYYAKINNNIFDLISDNDNPIIAQGGDIISVDNYSPNSSNSQVTVFGYLADEDYFADCGGGGSSSATSSLDSTTIANMIAGSGGGCDYQYPDGLNGEPIIVDLMQSDYTVPSGKNFYIQTPYVQGNACKILVNGMEVFVAQSTALLDYGTFIVKSGDIISHQPTSSYTHATLSGLLINASVDPIHVDLMQSDYTVPSGKNFYIQTPYVQGNACKILVNGMEVFVAQSTTVLGNGVYIVKSGDIISHQPTSSYTHANLSGYLADENYFADCGGNSGSGTSTGGPINPTGNVTSTLTDDSQINGYRIFYIRGNQIYESDSAFSFENKLYESTSSEYPLNYTMINHLHIDETNEILYFLESSNVSANATYIRKTSLKDFNPETVFIIPERINYISDLRVSPTTNEIYWSIGSNCGSSNNCGLYKYQQGTNQLILGNVDAFCFDNNGNYYYANGSNVYNSQSNIIYSGTSTIDMIQYDNSSSKLFMAQGGSDYVRDSQGNLLYDSQGYSITDIDIDEGSDEIIASLSSTLMNIDFSGNSRVCGISSVSIFSIAIFKKGTIDSSLVYNLNTYVLNDVSYWYVNGSRIWESDTSQLLNHNELYSSYNNGGFLASVFFDQNNQEIYYLESPNNSTNATYVKKTSIQSFNPQTVFIIPERITYISDLKVNPVTNEIYWSIGSNNNLGLYKYQQSISQLVSGNVDAFCFDNSGDYYYANGSTVYNSQGNNLYNSPSSIDILHYDNNSSTFFMAQGGSDQIWDSQGNTIYDSYGYSITDFDIDEQTQRILFSCGSSINIMDYNGSNFSVLEMRNASSYYITFTE